MPNQLAFLALDLGAESGRAVVGLLEGDRLRLEEVHRFPNGPVRLPDGLHWDVLRLWTEIKRGLALTVQEHGADLAGVGQITAWVPLIALDKRLEWCYNLHVCTSRQVSSHDGHRQD